MMGKKEKKVAIIGSGDDYGIQIDLGKFELWTMNNCYRNKREKYNRIFELHHIKNVNGKWYRRDSSVFGGQPVSDYIEELKNLDVPIYMHQKIKEIPRSIQFPIVQVIDRFPRGYFGNSFAWMIALAIIQGFNEIHIYNVCKTLEDISEYFVHRLSTEYILGVAEGLGIKVFVAEDSELLKSKYLYGYQENINSYENHINNIKDRSYEYSKYNMQHFLGFGHI
jgi:hypothetical protein